MRKLTTLAALCIGAFLALPALAEAPRKALNTQDVTKQETVVLGNSRFLIFSGTLGDHGQYGYTVDLVKIENAIPHFDPLFMEEYNADTNTAKLEYGVAFMALSYHFDKADGTLTYTSLDPETNTRLQFKYTLDVDIFKLDEVVSQKTGPCPKEPCTPAPPKTVFKAVADAKKN